MARPVNPNCPICKVLPKQMDGHGGLDAYCSGCRAKQSSRSSWRRRQASPKFATGWNKSTGDARKPPTDWREVLRKADENKGK